MPRAVAQVGLLKPKRRWLFFGGEDKPKDEPKDKSLADLWVEFLLKEAASESTHANPAVI